MMLMFTSTEPTLEKETHCGNRSSLNRTEAIKGEFSLLFIFPSLLDFRKLFLKWIQSCIKGDCGKGKELLLKGMSHFVSLSHLLGVSSPL